MGLVVNVAWIEVEKRSGVCGWRRFRDRDRGSKSQSGSGAESIKIIPSEHDSSILNKNSHVQLRICTSTSNRLLNFSELSILRDPALK